MYGGSGGSPSRLAVEAHPPAAVAERLEQLDRARARSPARSRRDGRASASQMPSPSGSTSSTSAAPPLSRRRCEARRDDLGVVDDDELAGELVGQVGERAMADVARRAVVDEQPRGVAPVGGMLRDQLGREARSRARPISSDGQSSLAPMDEQALERAKQRIAEGASGTGTRKAARGSAASARAGGRGARRAAPTSSRTSLPEQVGEAVQDGMRARCSPSPEPRRDQGLLNNAIRRLERLEQELIAERNARLDDLALLVDLVSSGWQGVDRRLERIERGRDRRDRVAARSRRSCVVATLRASASEDRRADGRPPGDGGEDRHVAEQDVLRLLAGVVPVQQQQVAGEAEDDERHRGDERPRVARRDACRARRRRSSRRRRRRAAGRRAPSE